MQETRIRTVRALHAVSQFRLGHFTEAINTFISLNTNPAKVVALYPETISGRLAVPEDEWIPLFGGPASKPSPKSETASTVEDPDTSKVPDADAEASHPPRSPSPQGSVRGLLRTGLDSLRSGVRREDELETASIRAKKKECKLL